MGVSFVCASAQNASPRSQESLAQHPAPAWTAVNTHPYGQATFEKLTRRKPQDIAIVAIARKLLVAVWHVLTQREIDQHAALLKVVCKFRNWYTQLDAAHRAGLSSPHYIRLGLLHLGLAE